MKENTKERLKLVATYLGLIPIAAYFISGQIIMAIARSNNDDNLYFARHLLAELTWFIFMVIGGVVLLHFTKSPGNKRKTPIEISKKFIQKSINFIAALGLFFTILIFFSIFYLGGASLLNVNERFLMLLAVTSIIGIVSTVAFLKTK